MKPEELEKLVEQQNETIEEMRTKLEEYKKDFDISKDLLEKHQHSGKETADISKILSDRLGIKVTTLSGAAEAISVDIMGIVVATGRAATGSTRVFDLFGNSFGIEWSGGGDPVLTSDLVLVPAYANNAAAITGGLVEGNIYRTGGNPDALCIVH